MGKIKNYLTRFFREDEGAELIEWAITIAIAGALVLIAFSIKDTMSNSMSNTQETLEENLNKD